MILALDPDLGLDFQLIGDSRSGFKSSKKRNCNTYVGLGNADPESVFHHFFNSKT